MFKLEGLKSVEKTFNDKLKELDGYTIESVDKVAEKLLELARPLAPIDTGELRKSGEKINKGKYIKIVYFQAFSPEGYDYSLIQHENLEFNHPKGGQPKYLEQPFRENTDLFINIIKNSVKKGVDN